MKNITIKTLITGVILSSSLISCVREHYDEPNTSNLCETLATTKTVQDITNTSTAVFQKYAGDDIIEAIVTSSDEGGTFYKSISFESVDKGNGTIGFSMPIDQTNVYNEFEPGRKVYIKMKDLYYYKNFGSTVIGELYDNDTPTVTTDDNVGRISIANYKNIIRRSCENVGENSIVEKPAFVNQIINDSYLNKLIEVSGVQFLDASVGKKYFDPTVNNLGGATNHQITDVNGNKIIVRISEFANFASKTISNKNGKIRGVLTKFNTDYQLIPRTEKDIQLVDDRKAIDLSPPLVGSSLVFNATITEPFTSYAVNQTNFPKYINDPLVGTRYWQLKEFSANKYIEMSSFNGAGNPGIVSKTFFFIPVDFTAANTFTFSEKIRFNQGAALNVYYISSANYTPGSLLDVTKLVNITSGFNITYPAIGASETPFNSAGTYNLPASLTGTGYFVFEYSGGGTVTTTVQIDDIVIN